MSTTDEILCQIEKGGTLDELAKVLGVSKSLLVARIEFLVRAGYLSEMRSGNECGSCANCKSCSVPGRGDTGMKMYMLTEKGRDHVKNKRHKYEK
jgi:predicted ArsR family transcriptional regulator